MAFGRNPHVAKAVAAEQKASLATDDTTRARALRDAAHQWERAAERETNPARRTECEGNATRNRELADSEPAAEASATNDPTVWN